jgi:cytochrome P450
MSTVARPDGAGAPSGEAPGLSGKAPVLPDGPSTPRLVQGVMAFAAPLWTLRRLHERYGSAFTIDIPVLGKVVIISDPAEVKQLFTTSPEIADTATTLAWAVERLRRHPAVLRRLADELDAGGSDLREATILEVQRVRPVIDKTGRQVRAPSMELGRWTLPRGQVVAVSIYLIQRDEALFPHSRRFDPDRFVGAGPDTYQWIPFGGGARRCLGAAFAHMEMNVVLRTLLRDFTLEPTTERGERWHSRGIAFCPAKGGRAVVHRRSKQ